MNLILTESDMDKFIIYDQVGGGGDDLPARPEQQLFVRQHVHSQYLIVKPLTVYLPNSNTITNVRRGQGHVTRFLNFAFCVCCVVAQR